MQQILNAATQTKSTDIVFIPVGMGVFLTHKKEEMKAEMLLGWINGLNSYQGPTLTLRCCLIPGQFETIQKALQNTKVTLINHAGEDAYTVANAVQDKLGGKSMLVNAGDHDWIVGFEQDKRPGQFSAGHTLFHSTSDEYFGLMTLFPAFSIANLRKFFTNLKQFIIGMPSSSVDHQITKTKTSNSTTVDHIIENKYAYKTLNPLGGRFHFFTVSSEAFDLNHKYSKSTGDYLKTQILEGFKIQIEKTASKEDLQQLKHKLMKTPEYQILKTGQGLFTKITGIKTSSVIAFETMCSDQERYLESAQIKPFKR
jgi:hypothetical protein